MMRNVTEVNFEKRCVDSNEAILLSIRQNGLVSAHRLNNQLLSNQTVQTSAVHQDICVNYINLNNANPKQRQIAFEAALNEEYLGVLGISLERTHPLQNIAHMALCRQEIQERLLNQVVFILKAPQLFPFRAQPQGADKPIDLCFYSPKKDDGFSQARSKSVFSGKEILGCSWVTEIKTNQAFALKDIIAILAPNALFSLCQRIFRDTTISVLSVAHRQDTLRALPQILDIYFKEKLTAPLLVDVPDYTHVLNDFCADRQLHQFALHAVRLNTHFDFTIRPVLNCQEHHALFQALKAQIVYQDEKGLGWIVMHKKDGYHKQTLMENLKKTLPEYLIHSFQQINRMGMKNFEKLLSLKADYVITILYQSLHAGQIHFLLRNGIDFIRTPDFFMAHCLKKQIPLLKQVVERFNSLQQQPATIIQAHYRGYRCHQFFKAYQKAKHEMETNKQCLLSMVTSSINECPAPTK